MFFNIGISPQCTEADKDNSRLAKALVFEILDIDP